MEKKDYKERINYIKSEKGYVGYPVNIKGVTIQAETLEDLKFKGKVLCEIVLEHLTKTINNDDPFDLFEFSDFDTWLYGERESNLRRELERYKDIFGELTKVNY